MFNYEAWDFFEIMVWNLFICGFNGPFLNYLIWLYLVIFET